ncbi:MAG: sulfurtransferase [Fuerstiella sp.]
MSTDSPKVAPITTGPFVNISSYRFVELDRLEERRNHFREATESCNLKGTILLSPEGINMFLAGLRDDMDRFLITLRTDPLFSDLEVKESLSDYQPFNRTLIKIKNEIIAFGLEDVNPIHRTSPKLSAKELKQWLDEGRPVHLLDTRNDYEVEIGTFKNAIPAGVDNFREFPDAVRKLPESMKDEPIVMFCTGGIRCEKAGPFMEQEGYKNVFQLDGGILKYFEECGGDHYDGDCFVFDQRVAVDPALQETEYTQCYICQEVVSPESQQSQRYAAGEFCPACYTEPADQIAQLVQQRNQHLKQLVSPLPGSQPYFNKRPLNVPQKYDGMTLLDFLAAWHPQVPRESWQSKIENSLIVPGERYGRRQRKRKSEPESTPLDCGRIVRAGERFENLLPETTEPDVNGDIRIIHEDDQFIVVNKPAPLPLHPSGRFNRNTLLHILQELYRPENPLLAHRLDANTSGVLLLCRKKSVARFVQPQFEQRTVSKQYLARIIGQPAESEFRCDAKIASEAAEHGLRLIDETDGQSAETRFQLLHKFADGTSLIRCLPITGRTNQIRLHLWHLGFSIKNDPAYLPDGKLGENKTLTVNDTPMCLHAESICLHDESGEARSFQAEAPKWANLAEA